VLGILAAIGLGGCGQKRRIDVTANVDENGRVIFEVPTRGVNGLLEFVIEDEAGKVLWDVDLSYEKGSSVTYGVLPAGGNRKARQVVPDDGSTPPDIRGRRVRVRVTYQYDDFMTASAGHYEKTVEVP
jgi:hypothetical protein